MKLSNSGTMQQHWRH